MCNIELTRADVTKLMEGEEVRIYHEGETVELSLTEQAKHRIAGYVAVP